MWAVHKRLLACLARNLEPNFKHSNQWKMLFLKFWSNFWSSPSQISKTAFSQFSPIKNCKTSSPFWCVKYYVCGSLFLFITKWKFCLKVPFMERPRRVIVFSYQNSKSTLTRDSNAQFFAFLKCVKSTMHMKYCLNHVSDWILRDNFTSYLIFVMGIWLNFIV